MIDGWPRQALEDVAFIQMGQSPPGSTYNTSQRGLPFLQGSAEFGEHYPNPVKWCSAPAKVAEPGDLMLSVRAPVGDTNFADQRLAIGRGLAVIRGRDGVLTEYLRMVVQAGTSDLLERSGSGMFASITGANLRAFQVPLPPEAEQRRIVDLIGALDAQIKALGTEKDEALMLRATLMSDHVAGCETRSSLGTVVDVVQGKALPKARQGVTSGPVPWFKIADMTGVGNHFGYNRANTSMTPEEIAALRGQILPIGSVVFPRVGAAVLTEKKRLLEVEGAVDENHLVLLPGPGTDSEYLLALMEWVHLSELVQSGAVPSLNMSLIRNFDVPVADPETQRALGHALGRLRVLGRALDEEVGAARTLRAITLAKVLSGGFEIPESYDALLAEVV